MPLKINVINCPSCGAALPIEKGKSQITCSYCGSKFTITNENEFVYRHVDEAQMKKAETERMQWLYEVEKEAKLKEAHLKQIQEREAAKKRRNMWIWSIAVIMIVVGLLKDNNTMFQWGIIISVGYLIYYLRNKLKKPSANQDIELPISAVNILPLTPDSQVGASKESFCGYCGAKIVEGAQFCPKCGKRIDDFSKSKTESIHRESFLESMKNPASLVTNYRQMSSKKKTMVLLVGLFLLLLIIVPPSKKSTQSQNTSSTSEVTNYRIAQGTEYAYVYDNSHVYIATAASDELINVERWEYIDGSLQRDGSVGAYRINDPENEFSWEDDDQMAFTIKLEDDKNYNLRYGKLVPFTIDINGQNGYRPTNYNPDVKVYTYINDESHAYIAIPLNEYLVKVECWEITKKDQESKSMYSGDRWILHTHSPQEDFEWTDQNRSSFMITLKDDKNYSWDKEKLVLFEIDNPEAPYDTCMDYILAKNENSSASQE